MTQDLSKLNLVELLDLLEPVPEPPAVSMWPQTAGWGIVAVFLLIGSAWVAVRALNRWRANAYRRTALQEIEAVGEDPAALAEILRRAALVAFPRRDVASLQGEAWLSFLDRAYGGKGFTTGAGRALVVAPYRSNTSAAGAAGARQVVEDWVRAHRRENLS